MHENSAAFAGDALLAELAGRPYQRPDGTKLAPSMGLLKKVSYTHEAMIELIILGSARPGGISQAEIAAHFGYSESWISNILASDAFQSRLAARRAEVTDPTLVATIKERCEALARKSLDVLMDKLNGPQVSDTVALKAFELGSKALGLGGNAPPPPRDDAADRLERLAGRLIALQSGARQGKVYDVDAEGDAQGQPGPFPGEGSRLHSDQAERKEPVLGQPESAAVRADGSSAGSSAI